MNEGMIGLASMGRDRGQATRDLAVLESMEQKQQQDQQQEFQAQQIQQAIAERTLAAADQLLEKDRAKINKKVLLNQKQIGDHLEQYGGSKAEFMSNGGLSVLGNMQNDILASEEFGMYKSNKENLAKIYEAQEKKLGHLLSPKDLESIKNYQENPEGGKISYSGMMAEVEIPHDKFMAGSEIHPYYIMSHNANMTKIMANYKMVHPDRPQPEKDENGQLTEKGRYEVVAFMKEMGYGGMGSSASLLAAKTAEAKARAEYEKKTNPTTPPATWLGGLSDLQQQIDPNLTAGKVTSQYMNDLMKGDKGDSFSALFDKDFTRKAKKRTNSHVNGSFMLNPIEGIGEVMDYFNSPLGIRGAKKLAITSSDEKIIMNEFLDGIDPETGTLKDYRPDETDYGADGTQLGDNWTDLADADDYKGDWKPIGVSTAFKSSGKDKEKGGKNKKVLLMDAYDGDEVDQEATDKMYPGMEDSEAELGYVIALENDKGDIIYKDIDLFKPGFRSKLAKMLPANDISGIVKEDAAQQDQRLKIQALDDQSQVEIESAKNALQPVFTGPLFKGEGEKYWGAESGGQQNRYDMQQSFYMALDYIGNKYTTGKGAISTSGVSGMIDKNIFTLSMKQGNVEGDLRDYNQTPDQIAYKWLEEINAIEEPGSLIYKRNQQIAERWMQYNNAL